MKIFTTIILLALISTSNAEAQVIIKKDTCIVQTPANTEALISGYKGGFLDLSLIINGFKLQLKDTSYKILNFSIAFDSDYCISQLISTGDQLIPKNDSIVQYKRIVEAQYLVIEHIKVIKNNICYQIQPLIYFISK